MSIDPNFANKTYQHILLCAQINIEQLTGKDSLVVFNQQPYVSHAHIHLEIFNTFTLRDKYIINYERSFLSIGRTIHQILS